VMVIDIMAMGHSALVMPEDGAADTPWTRDSNAQTADCDGKQSHSQITHTYIPTAQSRTKPMEENLTRCSNYKSSTFCLTNSRHGKMSQHK